MQALINVGHAVEATDGVDEQSSSGESQSDVNSSESSAPPPSPPPEIKAPPKPRAARKRPNPAATEIDEVCRSVRIDCISKVTGFNQKKANAVVCFFPDNTFKSILAVSVNSIAQIPVGRSEIGMELAKALKNVIA